jgi:hypothetical protein
MVQAINFPPEALSLLEAIALSLVSIIKSIHDSAQQLEKSLKWKGTMALN